MTPLPDPAANSPLATLRQLKELLDAGTITPQEFEALKQRLIFTSEASAPPLPVAPAGAPAGPPTPYLDTPGALTPEATPLLAPEPDWLGTPAAPLPLTTLAEAPVAEEPLAEYDEPTPERRNPLNLVFAIGGLLLFLGVVAYLTLGRPATPDEHLTSTTQTAADTTAAAPEVGPQAEQLTLPPAAAPETLRVAPAVVPVAAPTAAAADSAAIPAPATLTPPPAAPKPVPLAAPAAKAVVPKAAAPAAAPAAPDSAAGKQR